MRSGCTSRRWGSLQLSLPPFAGFSWTPQDVLSVLPNGLTLAFVASINILLTSRAVEHFRGMHTHHKRGDADAELGAYVSRIWRQVFSARP